ncbi:MAG: homoserine kinase [Actinomycetota bacterium]|nr:homoserine kinase [Actinomycetota bacterium]
MDLEVRVPATVANLGPGFDCLGVAIGLYLQVRVTESSENEIAGKGRIRSVDDSLIFTSWHTAFEETKSAAPKVKIEVVESYPSARGMGASASAIVAGLVAARAAGDLPLKDSALAKLAVKIEGHGDNVLPALFGGLVLTAPSGWLRYEPTPALTPLILVARERLRTEKARGVLPTQVRLSDAVANAASVAALVEVLSGRGPVDSLMTATEDRLHQPYRFPLMPESSELHRNLRDIGVPTALAGAGPSLICLVKTEELESIKTKVDEFLPDGWSSESPSWDLTGAQVR